MMWRRSKPKTQHVHDWTPNESWVRDIGTLMKWNKCACGEWEVTYRKPGPGWWVKANEQSEDMMRRFHDRRAS